MSDLRRRVLVLDDDADLRATLHDVFLALGAADCLTFDSLAAMQRTPEALETELALIDVNLGENAPTGVDAFGWLQSNSTHAAEEGNDGV